jgi:hypothetical protein
MTSLAKPGAGLKVGFKKFVPSSSSMIILIGRQTAGKTTTALTLSPKFDVNGPPGQVIDDIFVITNEKGALDCAGHCVSEVTYWVDLTDYTDSAKEYMAAEDAAFKMAKELAVEGKIRGIVYDNISTRDKLLDGFKSATMEGWALINWLMHVHGQFIFKTVHSMPVPVILTAHTQPVKKAVLPADRQTVGLEVEDREIINMTGNQAAGLFRAQASLVLPVLKTTKGGKTEYAIYPRGIDGIEAKCRIKNVDVEKIEPNMQKVFKMIQNNSL